MDRPVGRETPMHRAAADPPWVAEIKLSEILDQRREARRSVLRQATIYPIDTLADINVVNGSQSGIQGETSLELAVGETLHISFNEKTYCRGVVQWTTDHRFGLRFDEQIALAYAVHDVETATIPGQMARARRAEWNIMARIAGGRPARPALVRNVSPSGMQLELSGDLLEGQLVIVAMTGTPLTLSRVQWANDRRVGIKAI